MDNEVVGEISLLVRDRPRVRHTASFGMAVRDNWQGKGVGLADNWPSVKRVDLKVYADNEGGIALYEKFGFEIEGTYRRDTFRDGAYVNTYSMARLRS